MTPILEVRGLQKSFGSVVAARNIDVAVMPGEHIGLIGTNGAGKTTFVNMITGYIKPDRGTILLRGSAITGRSPRRITRVGVSRSFQIPQLFLSLTAEQNLMAALGIADGSAVGLRSGDGEATLSKLHNLLALFGLARFRRQVVAELPGGVRKLLDIALAVTRKPSVLLLDEPTSGVAAEEKFQLMDIVMEALPADVTVLFVEHDMEIVERYANRVLAFYEGEIIADGAPAAVLSDARVRSHVTGQAD